MSTPEVAALFPVLPRAAAVLRDSRFAASIDAVERSERARVWCRHGLDHLLDVARLAHISNLESGCGIPRDVVYAAALLHDIGRSVQYATGEDHDAAGARIAGEILGTVDADYRFSAEERAAIVAAVAGHRGLDGSSETGLDALPRLIAVADKASRPCYACGARTSCYWPEEKKNLELNA